MRHKPQALLLAAGLAICASSVAAQSCSDVSQKMPASRQSFYRRMIAARVPGHPNPKSVRLQHFMQSGEWSAVFSQPPESERGVFFFRLRQDSPTLVEVWSGVPGGDSVEQIADWTKTLDPNFPRGLALCFANAVEVGQ